MNNKKDDNMMPKQDGMNKHKESHNHHGKDQHNNMDHMKKENKK